jgi:hypothetical protein
LVPAPPGAIPTSAVVADVEQTGSLTPLLDQLLFDPDVTASSPSRRVFQALPETDPATPAPDTRMGDAMSITQASLRRLWNKAGPA